MRFRRQLLYIVALVSLAVPGECAGALDVTGPHRAELIQGHTYTITWSSSDTIQSVAAFAYGQRTTLGLRRRGMFRLRVVRPVGAHNKQATWKVPWVDANSFTIKLRGFDSKGKVVATAVQKYGFRPSVMANRLKAGLYLDLHRRTRQRLYIQKSGRIIKTYISSSSEAYSWRPRNSHPRAPHDHAGSFTVRGKERDHWSEEFDVRMPYAMRYLSGHYIHATSPNLYHRLGRAASHGCNRLTKHDALELYWRTRMGTRVEVIGPRG